MIVSPLITTITFVAGFTLPGGYKEDVKEFIQFFVRIMFWPTWKVLVFRDIYLF